MSTKYQINVKIVGPDGRNYIAIHPGAVKAMEVLTMDGVNTNYDPKTGKFMSQPNQAAVGVYFLKECIRPDGHDHFPKPGDLEMIEAPEFEFDDDILAREENGTEKSTESLFSGWCALGAKFLKSGRSSVPAKYFREDHVPDDQGSGNPAAAAGSVAGSGAATPADGQRPQGGSSGPGKGRAAPGTQ